jgi:hypothetical protein
MILSWLDFGDNTKYTSNYIDIKGVAKIITTNHIVLVFISIDDVTTFATNERTRSGCRYATYLIV